MIYTPLTIRAMKLAYAAHHGQQDKSGMPYIHHPLHLAEQMTDELTTCVALLHDIVEDTDVTLEALCCEFPPAVTDAVALMTHDPAVPYMEYVARIKENPIAKAVKIADLLHNSDATRMTAVGVAPSSLTPRFIKYQQALRFLSE